MTENRRYYYLKVKENFFDSEAMKILVNMQDGMIFSNLLMKMYYDNHAATIRRWAANDTEKTNAVQGVTALSCKEGTSL